MAYVGNPLLTTNYIADTFSGTGSQTTFIMSQAPANVNGVIVFVNNQAVYPLSYSVVNTQLIFNVAPAAGTNNISVRYLGAAGTPYVPSPQSVQTSMIAPGFLLPVNQGGTGANSLTANSLVAGNGTSPVNLIAPGTSGNVLTSNGTTWVSQAVAVQGFPSGTVLIFGQTAAPTGWTKVTTIDNAALRVVSGTAGSGGSVDFTTAFTSQTPSGSVSINTTGLSAGATTLSIAQMPSHSHTVTAVGSGSNFPGGTCGNVAPNAASLGTSSQGGGGSHTHTIAGTATGAFSGNAINLAVKYVDVIRATKD